MILQSESATAFTDDESGHEKLIHELMRNHGKTRDAAILLMNAFPAPLRSAASCGDEVVDVAGSLIGLETLKTARSPHARWA